MPEYQTIKYNTPIIPGLSVSRKRDTSIKNL